MIAAKNIATWKVGARLTLLMVFFGTLGKGSVAEEKIKAPLGTDQVVERMVTMNQQRAEALKSYRAIREYHLEYHGFLKNMSADVAVKMAFHSPDQKEFTIIAESGSKTLRERVLKRLLDAEVESMQKGNRERSAIRPENYQFRLVDYERNPEQELYVLEADPKVKNKFLFRGRIWVDGRDFAIVRIEGQPAKNPSWWTTRNDFKHSYDKVGEFWLPAHNETVTQVRIFGRALLAIDYKDYQIMEEPIW